MKKFDMIIIAVIIAFAGVYFTYSHLHKPSQVNSSLMANVYVDGKPYKSIPLSKEEKIIEVKTEYGKNIIKTHDDGVEIVDADCPDKICIDFGFKTEQGDQIVCLPNHIYIEIK